MFLSVVSSLNIAKKLNIIVVSTFCFDRVLPEYATFILALVIIEFGGCCFKFRCWYVRIGVA